MIPLSVCCAFGKHDHAGGVAGSQERSAQQRGEKQGRKRSRLHSECASYCFLRRRFYGAPIASASIEPAVVMLPQHILEFDTSVVFFTSNSFWLRQLALGKVASILCRVSGEIRVWMRVFSSVIVFRHTDRSANCFVAGPALACFSVGTAEQIRVDGQLARAETEDKDLVGEWEGVLQGIGVLPPVQLLPSPFVRCSTHSTNFSLGTTSRSPIFNTGKSVSCVNVRVSKRGPRKAARWFCGERSHSGVSKPCRLRRGARYGACGDERNSGRSS